MQILDGFLFKDCPECDGFGWIPVTEEPNFLPDPEECAPRFACRACRGLGIVRIKVDEIRVISPVEEEGTT